MPHEIPDPRIAKAWEQLSKLAPDIAQDTTSVQPFSWWDRMKFVHAPKVLQSVGLMDPGEIQAVTNMDRSIRYNPQSSYAQNMPLEMLAHEGSHVRDMKSKGWWGSLLDSTPFKPYGQRTEEKEATDFQHRTYDSAMRGDIRLYSPEEEQSPRFQRRPTPVDGLRAAR